MNEITNLKPKTESRFALTRKNQKGQVAIFVALIFQVIFVFFAVLINVGLIVHQKINLQQSTDLAAYYGAMKQAENMNAIAHVNFQIRQAWKLLTWRYRVLGTFGFRQGDSSAPSQHYPFERTPDNTPLGSGPGVFWYNGSAGTTLPDPLKHPGGMVCDNVQLSPSGEKLGVQDIPFFCVGHGGFRGWSQSESMCQLNCSGFDSARNIGIIPQAGNAITGFGGTVSIAVNQAIDGVNANLAQKCAGLGPTGARALVRFLAAYYNETYTRSKTIEGLAANLSLAADKMVDIEGNLIQKGSETTLKNNLTEANLTGYIATSFRAVNGLSANDCSFKDGLDDKKEFLKKIEFDFIRYFVHNCINDVPNPGSNFKPESLYDPSTGALNVLFNLPQQEKDILDRLMTKGLRHTVGYEKNPYCVEYYAVKASSEPQIPFLPLAKIKLNALAIAKPFGGSIGPWYGKGWIKGKNISEFVDVEQNTKTDETLPIRKLASVGGSDELSQSVYSQPNFSLFVGDKKGLRDLDYLAAYHSALAIRDIDPYPRTTSNLNINPLQSLRNGPPDSNGAWPDFPNWDGVRDSNVADFRNYDSLATLQSDAAGTRALEISAIAPNQFDITHYSIEPDFYTNYYKKLYKSGWDKIEAATGKSGSLLRNQLRADFGAVGMDADQPEGGSLLPRTFSVKDQIRIKNIIMDVKPKTTNGPGYPPPPSTYTKVLNYLISKQSSLLTGWTYLSFSDYKTFPKGPVDLKANTMSFGQCLDVWNNTVSGQLQADTDFRRPVDIDAKFPPTPGNCVTGGRTGYSVKLISPDIVRDGNEIENTIDPGFFSF